MHQAVVYEMKTAAAPEKHMANNKNERPSGGLFPPAESVVSGTRKSHRRGRYSQVQAQVLRAPILDNDGSDDEHGDAQQVVVKHRIPVLEPGDLDPLSHGQDVGGREQAVHAHPQVSDVEVGEDRSCRTDEGHVGPRDRVDRGPAVLGDHGVVNIGPGGDDRGTDHEEERDEREPSDVPAEPDDFTVGDQDDGQVFKDRVDGDREELLRGSSGPRRVVHRQPRRNFSRRRRR